MKPKILVVDDEESMRWFLDRTLRREGYDVDIARDGPDALRAAQANPPQVVLADVRMPGMDGVALLKALRAVAPGVPVVLMTAFGAVEDALQAMKLGAVDYITKPFRIEEIREVIARAVAGGPPRIPTLRDVDLAGEPEGSAASSSAAAASASLPNARVLTDPSVSLASILRDRARARQLPLPPDGYSGDMDLRMLTRFAESVYVDELLRLTEGNVSRAAEIAGITRPNLHRKIQDLGLSADAYRR